MHLYKTPQSNALVKRMHQVIYNIFVTKYIDTIVYDYIDPWGENISSFTWAIRSYYHHTFSFTPDTFVFVSYVLLNLMSIVD